MMLLQSTNELIFCKNMFQKPTNLTKTIIIVPQSVLRNVFSYDKSTSSAHKLFHALKLRQSKIS